MSDIILGGDFTVYYQAENRQKRIVWTGSATGTRTVNQLYSALADLLDDLNQMDDGSAMSAQTPTAYTIGIIDPSDKDPWFIDRTSVEHLTGGALSTASWARVATTNTGVVRIPYTEGGTVLIASDIGKTIANGTATGTILDYNTTGATKYLWIRPTDSTATHNWSAVSGVMTITGSTGNPSQSGASVTGEGIWANVFSLGTIVANSHLYVYQNSVKTTAYKGSNDWWPDGQFDVLLNVQEVGALLDGGFATIFTREYDNTYSDFTTDLHTGGRNPIPLATGSDLNNTTGYRQFTGAAGTGTFVVGEIIFFPGGGTLAAATKTAIVTKVAGTGAVPILDYYLIGTLTDFANTDAVKGNTSAATCTAAVPSNVGPANASPVTVTFGSNTTFDIPQSGTNQNYSIVIDLLGAGPQQSVAQGYEFAKFRHRRGETGTTFTNGLTGEQYIGEDYRIGYTTLTGAIAEGTVVTGVTSGASGTVVAHNTTAKLLILRNSRGTFSSGEIVRRIASNEVSAAVPTALSPIHAAPFGTFAGGTWFCAPGVVLKNVAAGDANKYQLVDDNGTVRKAPTSVTVAVTNTRVGDGVSVFRLTGSGGTINKTQYAATAQAIGTTTAIVGSAITQDTPGKTTGGVIRLVQGTAEYRTRYNSFAASTFTLASRTAITATAGTNATTIIASAATFVTWGILVGDLVRNTTRGLLGYVSAVNSETSLTVSSIAGQVTTDNIELNTLPVTTTTSDNYYVPVIDVVETTGTDGAPGSQSRSVVYLADVFTIVRVRDSLSGGLYNILPFESPATISTTGMSASAIRTKDTIST